jgi:hypothetical protein
MHVTGINIQDPVTIEECRFALLPTFPFSRNNRLSYQFSGFPGELHFPPSNSGSAKARIAQ